jgi:hypothetical protein
MEIISPGWFAWHALIGIAVGYALRLFEYLVWTATQDRGTGAIGFAIMIIPPSFVIGATLGYVSLILLTGVVKDATAISFSAYLLSAFWAFISLDVRDLLRRR